MRFKKASIRGKKVSRIMYKNIEIFRRQSAIFRTRDSKAQIFFFDQII